MEAAATPVKPSELVIPGTVPFSPDTPASRETMKEGVEYRYIPIINIEDAENPYMTGERGIISADDLKLNAGAANLDYFLAYIYVNQDNAKFMDKLLEYFKGMVAPSPEGWLKSTTEQHDPKIINYDEVDATLRRTNPDHTAYEKLRHTMTEYYVQFDKKWSWGSLGNILWENLGVAVTENKVLQPSALDFGGVAGRGGGKSKKKKSKSKKKKYKKKKSKKKKSKSRKKYKSRKKSKESI